MYLWMVYQISVIYAVWAVLGGGADLHPPGPRAGTERPELTRVFVVVSSFVFLPEPVCGCNWQESVCTQKQSIKKI